MQPTIQRSSQHLTAYTSTRQAIPDESLHCRPHPSKLSHHLGVPCCSPAMWSKQRPQMPRLGPERTQKCITGHTICSAKCSADEFSVFHIGSRLSHIPATPGRGISQYDSKAVGTHCRIVPCSPIPALASCGGAISLTTSPLFATIVIWWICHTAASPEL